MSLTFTKIVDKIDRACGTNSTSYTLAQKATDVNIAWDEVLSIALKNKGWDVDDWNQTDYPIITTNLVANQRDYSFTYDDNSSLILGISRVMIKNASGVFVDVNPVDQQDPNNSPIGMVDGQNATGTPTTYDKTSNGIFLDPIPSYSSTGGLKVFIDREPTYFTASDTTKVAGIDGLCHDYLYLKPAYEYARDKGLQSAERLFRDLQVARKKIDERYGRREKDWPKKMTPKIENTK